MKLETKHCDAAEFKMKDDGFGGFTGYASTFGNVDRGGDVVMKGAFEDSLEAFKRDGFIAIGHNWATSGIATIKEAYEDERGLYVDADFHSTPDAQAERTKIKERLDRGKSVGLSIGFKIEAKGQRRNDKIKARELTKIALFEVSVVTVPMNAEAQAATAKSGTGEQPAEFKALFEDVLAERVPSLWELWDVMTTCISRIVRLAREAESTGTEVDAAAMLDDAMNEFMARVRATALERISQPSEYGYYSFDPSNDGALVRQTFAAQADTALAAIDGVLARAKTINALRAKDERPPSVAATTAAAAIEERIDELKTAMTALHAPREVEPVVEPPPVEVPAEDFKALRNASLRAASLAVAVTAQA